MDVKMAARNHVAEAGSARTAELPMLVERVLVHLTAPRTTQRRVVAHHTVAAVKVTADKPDLTTKAMASMLAAITSDFRLLHQAVEQTCSTALHLVDNFAA